MTGILLGAGVSVAFRAGGSGNGIDGRLAAVAPRAERDRI
jgi:hypothetical protein